MSCTVLDVLASFVHHVLPVFCVSLQNVCSIHMSSYVFYHILPYLPLFEFATLRRCLHERRDLEGVYVCEAYTSYERSEVRKVFKAFDEDGSGSLDTEEIEQVMCSFGITPFKSTVEALPEEGTPEAAQGLGVVVVCRWNKFHVQIQQKVNTKLISLT